VPLIADSDNCRAAHCSNKWLTAVALHPGYVFHRRGTPKSRNPLTLYSFVQTEMGNISAEALGMEKPPNTIEESIKGVMVFVSPILFGFKASLLITIDHTKIDQATREKSSGKFYDAINNAEIPW
jgi:hypothetical protein